MNLVRKFIYFIHIKILETKRKNYFKISQSVTCCYLFKLLFYAKINIFFIVVFKNDNLLDFFLYSSIDTCGYVSEEKDVMSPVIY